MTAHVSNKIAFSIIRVMTKVHVGNFTSLVPTLLLDNKTFYFSGGKLMFEKNM